MTNAYLAMDKIEAGPYVLQSDNNIILKASNSIKLLPGFKVTSDNNYFYAKAGKPVATKMRIIEIINDQVLLNGTAENSEMINKNNNTISSPLSINKNIPNDLLKQCIIYLIPMMENLLFLTSKD
ncbi:MAG: hypothetical protein R2750_14685 [Bacteroidales bacterium]